MTADQGRNRPSFFIIGAPKCGTSSMAAYLSGHPGLFMCEPKEPHYFCTDLPNRRVYKALDTYLPLFDAQAPGQLSGEASTWYLYSQDAAREILEFDPAAKFIVMLRNPVEMAPSLHSQFVYDLFEKNPDFAAVWRERSDRYVRCCSLGEQVERLLKTVDRQRVHFVLFDDFRQDVQREFLAVARFLGVEERALEDYPVVNVNKQHRSPLMARILYRTPKPVEKLLAAIKSVTGIRKLGLAERLESKNLGTKKRNAVPAELLDELASTFADDVALLGDILQRDLTHWVRPPNG